MGCRRRLSEVGRDCCFFTYFTPEREHEDDDARDDDEEEDVPDESRLSQMEKFGSEESSEETSEAASVAASCETVRVTVRVGSDDAFTHEDQSGGEDNEAWDDKPHCTENADHTPYDDGDDEERTSEDARIQEESEPPILLAEPATEEVACDEESLEEHETRYPRACSTADYREEHTPNEGLLGERGEGSEENDEVWNVLASTEPR